MIKIGPVTYSVDDQIGDELDGEIAYTKQQIHVRALMGADYANVVLWHEVLHGLFTHSGLAHLFTSEQAEALMDCFSYGIVQVLQDNPNMREP